MIEVKNNQTGEVESIDDKDLPNRVISGEFSIPQKEYEFLDEAGDKFKVPAQGFLEAVKAGWKYRDSGLIKEEKLREKYGDSTGKALLYGGLRGASLGISDAILTKTGLADQEELSAIKEYNPVASNVGEIGATVGPALLSGGTSLVAKASQKTLAGLLTKGAEYTGKRAAQNITSNVAKAAVNMGVAGAVEGAVLGAGQTVSEAALGDAEFNAESLMSNMGTGALLGGAFGASLGVGAEALRKGSKGVFRASKRKMIDGLEIPASEKAELLTRIDDDDIMDRIASVTFGDDSEVAAAAARQGLSTPTTGTLSTNQITKGLESSLEQSPSIAGAVVKNETKAFRNEVSDKVEGLVKDGIEKTAYDAGEEMKSGFIKMTNDAIRPAKEMYQKIYKNFGEFDVSERIIKMAKTRMEKSDLYKLHLDKGLVQNLGSSLDNVKTLNQATMLRKQIGKLKAAEYKKFDRDFGKIDLLDDMYQTLKRVEDRSITDAAALLPGKIGRDAVKEASEGLKKANASYAGWHKQNKPLLEALGIKATSPELVMDILEDMPSEVITKKLFDVNDYNAMKALKKSHPEVFDIARKRKLAELHDKITDSSGKVSLDKFLTQVKKMSPQHQEILFGFDGAAKQKIKDLVKVASALPKNINPSGTSVNLSFMDMLNPVFQGKELLRYALYRGGDDALKKYLTKAVPAFSAIESSSNKQKNKISSSINGFFKVASVGVTLGALEALSEKDLDKARKSYEMVQENPEQLINKFTQNNKDLMEAAPETANALQQRIIAGVQFLQSKVPHVDQEYIGEKISPSRSEMIKFNDYVEAVERPQVIYDQLKEGYLNPNTLETLRTVYPATYAGIQAELLAKIPKHLTRAQKIQLQPILGSKVTPAMDYKNMMILQGKTQGAQMANAQAQQEMNTVPMGAGKNLKSSSRAQTGLDKTLNRS